MLFMLFPGEDGMHAARARTMIATFPVGTTNVSSECQDPSSEADMSM